MHIYLSIYLLVKSPCKSKVCVNKRPQAIERHITHTYTHTHTHSLTQIFLNIKDKVIGKWKIYYFVSILCQWNKIHFVSFASHQFSNSSFYRCCEKLNSLLIKQGWHHLKKLSWKLSEITNTRPRYQPFSLLLPSEIASLKRPNWSITYVDMVKKAKRDWITLWHLFNYS